MVIDLLNCGLMPSNLCRSTSNRQKHALSPPFTAGRCAR